MIYIHRICMFRDVILFNKKYSATPVSMFFICLSTIVVPIGCKYEKFLVHVEGYNLNEICFLLWEAVVSNSSPVLWISISGWFNCLYGPAGNCLPIEGGFFDVQVSPDAYREDQYWAEVTQWANRESRPNTGTSLTSSKWSFRHPGADNQDTMAPYIWDLFLVIYFVLTMLYLIFH